MIWGPPAISGKPPKSIQIYLWIFQVVVDRFGSPIWISIYGCISGNLQYYPQLVPLWRRGPSRAGPNRRRGWSSLQPLGSLTKQWTHHVFWRMFCIWRFPKSWGYPQLSSISRWDFVNPAIFWFPHVLKPPCCSKPSKPDQNISNHPFWGHNFEP